MCGINSTEYLYVDTETTGLGETDELLCVSVLDDSGKVVYHSLVRPKIKTHWEEAQKINNISPEMVKNAPELESVISDLSEIFKGKHLVAYNMKFDARFLKDAVFCAASLHCCMLAYAEFRRVPDTRHGNGWKWHKLINAVANVNGSFTFQAHDSTEDCRATREVWTSIMKDQTIARKYGFCQS
jgi:DNA polymerase-3 subunit epsilon